MYVYNNMVNGGPPLEQFMSCTRE